jgi:hypothetical protein
MDKKWVGWHEAMDLVKHDIFLLPKANRFKGLQHHLGRCFYAANLERKGIRLRGLPDPIEEGVVAGTT